MNPLLQNMNERQQQAIMQTDGPLLILAGAGSGKTRVVTHRIAYLIDEMKVAPWNILAITFTNKAAREMKERTTDLTTDGENVWISTFHSMCVSILRRHIDLLGYDKNFAILDDADQLSLLKQILKDLNIDSKKLPPKYFLARISEAKNDLLRPEDITGDQFLADSLKRVYETYQATLKQHNRLDFDDLLMLTVQLFKNHPDVLAHYQQKFQYIHVDEYQDTNHTQYQLVKLLAGSRRNICVVGDSDQSIYSWRGADITNILNFEKDYEDATVIKLEQNYRSTQTILDAANDVISNNPVGYEKRLFSELGAGPKISAKQTFSAGSEVEYVASKIKHSVNAGTSHEDIVILYRTNSQSRLFEQHFMKENIPYRLVGGLSYFKRLEIKDLVAFLRLITNPNDNFSFDRIVNVPARGIGRTTIGKLTDMATNLGVSKLEALPHLAKIAQGGIASKLLHFHQVIVNLQEKMNQLPLCEFIDLILEETDYMPALRAEATIESRSRIENLEEFKTMATSFEKDQLAGIIELEEMETTIDDMTTHQKLEILLTDIALQTDVSDADQEGEKVTLMTTHSAKGLEFDTVFLVGFEEGLFPLHNAIEEGKEAVEEERRLAYVAITRAKRQLYLTYAKSRMHFGHQSYNNISRFLKEIKEERLEHEANKYSPSSAGHKKSPLPAKKSKAPAPKVSSVNLSNHNTFNSGDKVNHATWGDGVVVSADGKTVSIAFGVEHGIKKLMAGHPSIKKK